MNSPWWLQLLQTVIFPALALAATGLVTVIVSQIRKKLDKNTDITAAAADDQAEGFQAIGKWRYEMNEKFARLEERLRAQEDKSATIQRRVERIPTESQFNYKMELTPAVGLPTVAPPVPPLEKK
jgi:hypothetical protein